MEADAQDSMKKRGTYRMWNGAADSRGLVRLSRTASSRAPGVLAWSCAYCCYWCKANFWA